MNPHELAEKRVNLAGEYSRKTEQLSDLLALRPMLWTAIRKGTQSDKAADRAWEGTEEGIREMRLRNELKSMEKEMSAIRTMLEVLQGEARNQY